jgi:hypothetical protein
VVKEEETKERSKRKKVVEREDRGRQINKEDGLWTTQEAKKSKGICFGAPHREEGKTGW